MSSPEPSTEGQPAEAEQARDGPASDANRPLTPDERYRALTDAFDFQQDLIDLGDHKARFALVIMGGLNVVAFLLLVHGDFLSGLPAELRAMAGAYLAVYASAAVYFCFQAIEALRPRLVLAPPEERRRGLRFFTGILGRNPGEYSRRWREVSRHELCDEIAEQVHALSWINHRKYAALRRLYLGLQVMTMMTALPILIAEMVALF